MNCDIKRLKGAALVAFSRLDNKTKIAIIVRRELNQRSMGIVASGNVKIEVPQSSGKELDDIFEKNKNSGRIDGYCIGRLKNF